VPQPPRDQGHGQRQRRQDVPRREPEAEHGGREEGRDHELRAERGSAQPRGELDLPDPGHGARQPVAQRAPQPPEPGEGEGEHRRPAQQAVLAVEEQGDQAVHAVEVAARERGVGGALPGDLRRVGRRTAVEGLVEAHVQRDAEERQLHGADRERAPAGPPQRPGGERPDHEARQHELRAEPGKRPEQGEAGEGVAPARPPVEPEREQRGAGERRAGAQLGVDRARVGEERWAQPNRDRGPDRPGIGRHVEREPVGERHREGGDRGEEELHALLASHRVGRQDEEREADPVGLVEAPLGLLAVALELVGIEAPVSALGVLVPHVHVAVVHERLRSEQVVRLVSAVVRVAEGVEAERGRVGAEQDQPEGERAPHERRPLSSRARGRSPSAAPRPCPRRS
jgi:hypothetical protein